MPEKLIAKGNTIEEVKASDGVAVIGYKLRTGAEGEELEDSAFCGTREVTYMFPEGKTLKKYARPNICGIEGLKCGQIYEVT